jgi:hypothetical protein
MLRMLMQLHGTHRAVVGHKAVKVPVEHVAAPRSGNGGPMERWCYAPMVPRTAAGRW